MTEINLMGDSQLCRYANFLQTTGSLNKVVGITASACFSGATVADFKKLIKKSNTYIPPESKILLCLGTNDIVKNTPLATVKTQFLSLLKLIRKRHAPKLLLILALPPFLRFIHNNDTLAKLDDFNKFLSTIQTHSTRLLRLAITTQNAHQFFEPRYYPSGRKDGIHLNANAFAHLTTMLAMQLKEMSYDAVYENQQ